MTGKEREITREELYKLVWSKPMTELAKEFGMSDVGLAKVCKKLNVPRPYRGYWQLAEVDRKTVPPLPPARKGNPTTATISPETYRPKFAPLEPAFLDRLNAETLPKNRIEVSSNLRGAHPLVRDARDAIEGGYTDSCHRMRAAWSVRSGEGCLDIRVSKKTLPRALRIMDALVKALEARGCEIKFDKGRAACQIDEERVHFYLWETVKRSEREPTEKDKAQPWRFDKWEFTPAGELTLTLDESCAERKNWRDRKKKRLEDQLNDIVVGIFISAEKLRLREAERRDAEQLRLEAVQRHQEMERERQLEDERRSHLDYMVTSWIRSQNLRQFLHECEKALPVQANTVDRAGESWLAWARAYSDLLNPFKNGSFQEMVGTD
jgi:hypothetical protein